jgi:hypothetical protein
MARVVGDECGVRRKRSKIRSRGMLGLVVEAEIRKKSTIEGVPRDLLAEGRGGLALMARNRAFHAAARCAEHGVRFQRGRASVSWAGCASSARF